MRAAIKAEFTKLLTIRSTYFLTGLVWVIIAIVSFYAIGYKANQGTLLSPHLLQETVFGMAAFVGIVASIVGVLVLAHEYRYNTINYSLTISNSRTKVLVSKFLVVTVYAVVFGVASIALAIGLIHAGAAAHGYTVGSQSYGFWPIIGQAVFSVWANAMAGLILVVLIRSMVGSIVALFIVPAVEGLLGQVLLKTNVGYLPFTALGQVTPLGLDSGGFSVTKSLLIVTVYIVIFAVIAHQLFLRRDAN